MWKQYVATGIRKWTFVLQSAKIRTCPTSLTAPRQKLVKINTKEVGALR